MIKYKSILFVFTWLFAVIAIAQETGAEQLRMTGRVLDASTLMPLPGMSISLPDVSAAMTDDNGEFSIRVPSYDVELRVSGPGYQSKLIAGKGRERVEVLLYEAGFQSVYKEVLTPLGEINNSRITTSMSVYDRNNSLSTVISGEELLQGNIAGLNVLLRSGMDGAGGNMFMRGFNSIYANTQPLLVLDGLIIENQSSGVSLVDGFLSTPLGVIDVKDIERITVMKDGTSMYGIKGGNGVILIETLRSKEVATKIDIRAVAGINMTPSKIPLLNASQQKKYLADLYQSAGYTAQQIQDLPFINQQKPVLQKWGYDGNVDYYRYNHNTDWQDQLFTESFKQNYSLGVTGGDDIAVYALTLGYQVNEGLIRGNDYSRFNARLNTDISLSDRLKLHSNMYFVYGKRNLTDQGGAQNSNPLYASLIKAPFMSQNVYNEEGLSSPNYEGVDLFGFSNPTVITENAMQENSNYGFLGSMELAYNVWRDLTVSTAVGLRFYKERERVFLPGGIAHDTLSTAIVNNAMQHRVERTMSLSNETRANYLFKFAHDHSLDATLGFRYQHNKIEDDWGKSYNSPSDDFTSLGNGLNALALVNGSLGTWNWVDWYANLSYGLKNRYFITATASLDRSSRYGESIGNYQAFPSISGAWLISSERFMQNADFVDMLKVRMGYSVSGNDDIGNYTSRHYYGSQNLYGNYGLIRGNIVNTDLGPERVGKLNLGVDMAFLNERLAVTVDVYKTKVKDMITYSPISKIAGFHTYISNDGEMENKGVDLSLYGRLINHRTFKWDMGVTASFYKNKVTKLPASYETDFNGATILTQTGSPLGVFYGYKTDGIYTTSDAAKNDGLYYMNGLSKVAYEAGDVRFVNQNSDDLIDENDRVVIGDPNPDMYGGITTSLKWNRFSLSALFTYSVGNDIYNYTRQQLESMSGFANQTQAVLNRWKVEGQNTSMPRAYYGDPMGNSRFSDRWIENGSFLKFKNLTLSYDVPIRSGVFTGLQVFAVGENLCTLTSYKGYDPEFSVTANPLGYGIDAFITPQARTFYIGVKIGL